MVEYTEREGMQVKLEDVSQGVDIADTYVARYNWVVSRYNGACEKSYEELEYLPTGCGRRVKYATSWDGFCNWMGMLFCAIFIPILSALVFLIIWLVNLKGLLTYRRNNKKENDILSKFLYNPDLCGGSNNKYFELSMTCYKAGILSLNGQNMHIDAARIQVTGNQIKFMAYNDVFKDFSVCVRRMYIFYTINLIVSWIMTGVSICFLVDYFEIDIPWFSS